VKRLSFIFFVVAVLLAGVAIAAVVVRANPRANGLLPQAVAASPAQDCLTSN